MSFLNKDAHGNPICGQDFMAGTICTLPPDHDGFHAPICQECGGDWYASECTCPDCPECGGPLSVCAKGDGTVYVWCACDAASMSTNRTTTRAQTDDVDAG